MICPNRMTERNQVFNDCVHLLALHEPGNELHLLSEVSLPGGSVDFFLVSAKAGRVKDFVGIEVQALDTTGSVWSERTELLRTKGFAVDVKDSNPKRFGINWKMTAKTTLLQMHHKIATFENLGKHLVLVVQDSFLDYMKGEFNFAHMNAARLGDSFHVHSYTMVDTPETIRIELDSRLSTDAEGISLCLGLQADARVGVERIIRHLESRISEDTLLQSIRLADPR